MLLFTTIDVIARWAFHNGLELKTPRIMKLDDIIRVCHMATNPLCVLVSHLEQARKDRRRQMKAAHLRTSQINENAKAKKRQGEKSEGPFQ